MAETLKEYQDDIVTYTIEELSAEITKLRKYVQFLDKNPGNPEESDIGWTLCKLNVCADNMDERLNGKKKPFRIIPKE